MMPMIAILGDLPTLSLAPVLSLWLVIPGLLAAVVLTVMLYRSQRLMAPRRTVLFLTILRALLIGMLAVLFLQPAMQWSQTRTKRRHALDRRRSEPLDGDERSAGDGFRTPALGAGDGPSEQTGKFTGLLGGAGACAGG